MKHANLCSSQQLYLHGEVQPLAFWKGWIAVSSCLFQQLWHWHQLYRRSCVLPGALFGAVRIHIVEGFHVSEIVYARQIALKINLTGNASAKYFYDSLTCLSKHTRQYISSQVVHSTIPSWTWQKVQSMTLSVANRILMVTSFKLETMFTSATVILRQYIVENVHLLQF